MKLREIGIGALESRSIRIRWVVIQNRKDATEGKSAKFLLRLLQSQSMQGFPRGSRSAVSGIVAVIVLSLSLASGEFFYVLCSPRFVLVEPVGAGSRFPNP